MEEGSISVFEESVLLSEVITDVAKNYKMVTNNKLCKPLS